MKNDQREVQALCLEIILGEFAKDFIETFHQRRFLKKSWKIIV